MCSCPTAPASRSRSSWSARLLGVRTVYLEVYDRISRPTLTGRLCYPLAELFLLQWPEQAVSYPRGKVIGAPAMTALAARAPSLPAHGSW